MNILNIEITDCSWGEAQPGQLVSLEVDEFNGYVMVRNMTGLNDQDITDLVRALSDQGNHIAQTALRMAQGHFVDLRSPMGRACDRLYMDGEI